MEVFKPISKEIRLRSLDDFSSKIFSLHSSHPLLFLVFQPHCQACKKQIQAFSCLPSEVQVVLLGAFATESQLRKDHESKAGGYPRYLASPSAFKNLKINNDPFTPQIIAIHKNKKISFLGYDKDHCAKIKNFFENEKDSP